mmetsp:Transcript_1044/g.2988  ORF Transcript_1044/g.2988 Transcript_1044/m.2988 type:complete len:202 (-) Transcript_1044:516-1121(-)
MKAFEQLGSNSVHSSSAFSASATSPQSLWTRPSWCQPSADAGSSSSAARSFCAASGALSNLWVYHAARWRLRATFGARPPFALSSPQSICRATLSIASSSPVSSCTEHSSQARSPSVYRPASPGTSPLLASHKPHALSNSSAASARRWSLRALRAAISRWPGTSEPTTLSFGAAPLSSARSTAATHFAACAERSSTLASAR